MMWKRGRSGLSIYADKYKEFDVDIKWLDEWTAEMDVYELWNDELCGCMFFHPLWSGHMMHIAVTDSARGRWMFMWPELKKWMLDKYGIIYGGTHSNDFMMARLLPRCGFEFMMIYRNYYWWKLWA